MRAVWVVALVLLLAGCSAPPDPPPEPTGAELAELSGLVEDLQWHYLGLTPDAPRPAVVIERYITPDEADDVYEQCMSDAGFHNWKATTGAITLVTNSERVELFLCVSRFPLPPAFYDFYSNAQRKYLYDYYVDQVVPCLSASEVEVGVVPTRDEFLATRHSWSPYQVVRTLEPSVREQLYARCPDLSGSFFTS